MTHLSLCVGIFAAVLLHGNVFAQSKVGFDVTTCPEYAQIKVMADHCSQHEGCNKVLTAHRMCYGAVKFVGALQLNKLSADSTSATEIDLDSILTASRTTGWRAIERDMEAAGLVEKISSTNFTPGIKNTSNRDSYLYYEMPDIAKAKATLTISTTTGMVRKRVLEVGTDDGVFEEANGVTGHRVVGNLKAGKLEGFFVWEGPKSWIMGHGQGDKGSFNGTSTDENFIRQGRFERFRLIDGTKASRTSKEKYQGKFNDKGVLIDGTAFDASGRVTAVRPDVSESHTRTVDSAAGDVEQARVNAARLARIRRQAAEAEEEEEEERAATQRSNATLAVMAGALNVMQGQIQTAQRRGQLSSPYPSGTSGSIGAPVYTESREPFQLQDTPMTRCIQVEFVARPYSYDIWKLTNNCAVPVTVGYCTQPGCKGSGGAELAVNETYNAPTSGSRLTRPPGLLACRLNTFNTTKNGDWACWNKR